MEKMRDALNRYSRFLDTDDARKTLDELDAVFGLNTDVINFLNKQTNNAHEIILAREGARAYSTALRTLVARTKQQMEMMNERTNADT